MSRSALYATAGGCISALVLTLAFAGPLHGAVFAYFTPLALMAVGLGLGTGASAIAAAAGAACIIIFGHVTLAAVFGGMHALPSWLAVRVALSQKAPAEPDQPPEWASAGDVLAAITVFAVAAIVFLGVMGGGGLEASIESFVGDALDKVAVPIPQADPTALARMVAPVFVGACGASWILMMVLNAVLAQGLLVSRGANLRPSPKWSALSLPGWLSWPLVGSAALAIVATGDTGYLARNLVLVCATPFFFVGLAVAHVLARRTAQTGVLLALMYVGLMLVAVPVAALITTLGLIEEWWGVRRRFGGTPTS